MDPDCLFGSCIIGFDQLAEEDLRLLEIRWLLVHLGDYGLGQRVAKEYRLNREDLCSLAVIESECRAMVQPQGEEDGEGS